MSRDFPIKLACVVLLWGGASSVNVSASRTEVSGAAPFHSASKVLGSSLPAPVDRAAQVAVLTSAGAEALRMEWISRLEQEIEFLQTVLLVNEFDANELRHIGEKLVSEDLQKALPVLKQKVRSLCRELEDLRDLELTSHIRNSFDYTIIPPDRGVCWQEAVRAKVSAQQWRRFQGEETRRDEFVKSILGSCEETFRDCFSTNWIANIERALVLNPNRYTSLVEIQAKVTEQIIGDWKRGTEWFLKNCGRKRLEEIRAGEGDDRLSIDCLKEKSGCQTVLQEAIARFLTQAEREKVKQATTQFRQTWIQVIAQVSLMSLDMEVGFSKEQRQQLQPLIEKWLRGKPEYLLESDPLIKSELQNLFSPFSPTGLLSGLTEGVASEIEGGSLGNILEPQQIERWSETAKKLTAKRQSEENSGSFTVLEAGGANVAKSNEPEAREQALLEVFALYCERKRAYLKAIALKEAGFVARVARVPHSVAERFHTAALGAVETSLELWKTGAETDWRSQIRQVGRVELGSSLLENWETGEEPELPQEQEIWVHALENELTLKQRCLWKVAEVERESFLRNTRRDLGVLFLNWVVGLNPQQKDRVSSLLDEILNEYPLDLAEVFSQYEELTEAVKALIPMVGIPVERLRVILSPLQWERWNKAALINPLIIQMWSSVREFHDQRIRILER